MKIGKRLIFLFIAIIMMTGIFCTSVFAETEVPKTISADVAATENTLVNVSRPEASSEVTYSKTYIFSGSTTKKDITVYIYLYNPETDKYELYEDTSGETAWKLGASGLFTREVSLKYQGVNKFLIVARQISNNTETIQYTPYSLTLYEKPKKITIELNMDIINNFLKQIPQK